MLLVSIDDLEKSDSRFNQDVSRPTPVAAIEDKPTFETFAKVLKSQGNESEDLLNRKTMLEKVHTEPLAFAYDRAIGENDSVYSNFCELISFAKRSVGRIVIKRGGKNIGYATGFMVSETLLLTNWHVFKTIDWVGDSEVEFNYELDIYGRSLTETCFKLNAQEFYHSNEELDYCFIAVCQMDVTGKVLISSVGHHYLDPDHGKVGEDEKEFLNIIHHPKGDYKQLSIRENKFKKRTPNFIWYETDTAQGSSGSPVLNDQWQVVALHHMGKAARSADDKYYVDKEGKIIPVIDKKIDISKIYWIANEGTRISVIIKSIFDKYPNSNIVNSLKIKPDYKSYVKVIPEANKQIKPQNTMEQNGSNVNVSIPSSLVENGKSFTISINNGLENNNFAGAGFSDQQLKEKDLQGDFLLEVAKIDKDAIDFSECNGYDPKFLGKKVPLPQPTPILLKNIAKLKGSKEIELKYFQYSVIFNAVTRMPAISAVNVEGAGEQRKDNSTRQDDWLRDNRIEREIQLRDKWYDHSKFDKGHMSRWEDANWGPTKKLANRNGVFTCFYTNACPQVLELNRAGGLWGKLEHAVLRDGVLKEEGELARVTVFNGPIHKNTDDVFRGIKVPLDYYKIVLWLNNDGDLKATAFILSQRELVGKIDWNDVEELEPEAIDIHKVEKFKEYQCKIKALTTATKIDFSGLYEYDTFGTADNDEEETLLLNSEEQLTSIIKKHAGTTAG